MSTFYVAVLETNSEGVIFATLPDLPGVNAAADTAEEALALAIEFANDHVRDLVETGHPVPPARGVTDIPVEPDEPELARALIPVEVPGKSVKISLSIEEALLTRIDRAAEKAGMTRSGLFAAACDQYIRARVGKGEAGKGEVGASRSEEAIFDRLISALDKVTAERTWRLVPDNLDVDVVAHRHVVVAPKGFSLRSYRGALNEEQRPATPTRPHRGTKAKT